MHNQNENVIRNRAGIVVRDYTQDGDLSSLVNRFEEVRKGGLLNSINFHRISRGLVWLSLGLGLAEIIAPGQVQKMVGVRRGDHSRLIRLMGLRELASAVMITMAARTHRAVWSRVAGDALDLGLLGLAYNGRRTEKKRAAGAAAFVAGAMALDALTATRLTREHNDARSQSTLTREELNERTHNGAFHVSRSTTINRSPEELYQFWRNFDNLPMFMFHLEEVQIRDERRSHWVAKAPAGTRVAWDAEITEDQPNERIAWRSIPGAAVENRGVVRFKPATGGRGTVVQVEIEYRPPGGIVGRTFAQLFGSEPAQQVKGDLNRFKQMIETGDVVLSDGNPIGTGLKIPKPAHPGSFRPERKQSKNIFKKLVPGKTFIEAAPEGNQQEYNHSRSPEENRMD